MINIDQSLLSHCAGGAGGSSTFNVHQLDFRVNFRLGAFVQRDILYSIEDIEEEIARVQRSTTWPSVTLRTSTALSYFVPNDCAVRRLPSASLPGTT